MAGPVIVGLHGPAGSGKTFCGDFFVHRHGWARVKFADPLKDMLRTFLRHAGVSDDDMERYIEGDRKDVPTHYLMGATPRWAMQALGGEWGRIRIDPELWVNTAMLAAMRHVRMGRSVVIDDCRYANEAEAIRLHGGKVVEIIGRRHTVAAGNHASEEPLEQRYIDLALNNTGDAELAASEVSRIIRSLT